MQYNILSTTRYSPTETLVEFDFGCKFGRLSLEIDIYALREI
jgi:hypothetical protein